MMKLTTKQIRAGFREMASTGDSFLRKIGEAGLYADDFNRNRLHHAFEYEVDQALHRAERRERREAESGVAV